MTIVRVNDKYYRRLYITEKSKDNLEHQTRNILSGNEEFLRFHDIIREGFVIINPNNVGTIEIFEETDGEILNGVINSVKSESLLM